MEKNIIEWLYGDLTEKEKECVAYELNEGIVDRTEENQTYFLQKQFERDMQRDIFNNSI